MSSRLVVSLPVARVSNPCVTLHPCYELWSIPALTKRDDTQEKVVPKFEISRKKMTALPLTGCARYFRH